MTRSVSMFLALFTLTAGCAAHRVVAAPPVVPAMPERSLPEQLLDAELRACVAEPNPAACFDSEAVKTADPVQLLTIELARTQWRLAEAERQAEKDVDDTEDEPAVDSTPLSGAPYVVTFSDPAEARVTLDDMVYTTPPIASWESCRHCLTLDGVDRVYGPDAVAWVETPAGETMPIVSRGAAGSQTVIGIVQTKNGVPSDVSIARARSTLHFIWPVAGALAADIVVGVPDETRGDGVYHEVYRHRLEYSGEAGSHGPLRRTIDWW